MRKLRKIILILLVLVIVIIIAISFLKKNKNDNNSIENKVSDSQLNETYNEINKMEPVTSRANYYIIENIIDKYYNAINKNNNEVLYNYLANSYIKDFNVKKQNLSERFNISNEYKIDDMYVLTSMDNIFTYLVKTSIQQNETPEIKLVMVAIDVSNSIFEVYPDEYVKKYVLNTIDNFKVNKIEFKQDNKYSFEIISNEEMTENYLKDFKQYIKNKNYLGIYELLDEEYKEAKFNNYEEFEEYIKINYDRMSRAYLDMYKVINYDDYTQYICIDSKENYYIFNETAVMKYTIMLDNYTIDLPSVENEYNNLKETQKATLNVKKFLKAVEDSDYKYAYSKLSKDFRKNYFENQESFEQYAKDNIINNKDIKNVMVEEKDGLFVCTVTSKISNMDYSSEKFIVQLNEGTDFEFSFKIKK